MGVVLDKPSCFFETQTHMVPIRLGVLQWIGEPQPLRTV
ncbi:MAG: hypothetical protein RJA09_506 [Pseudomonadota bacterium]